MKHPFLLFIFALLPFVSEARLNETLKECELRYGKGIKFEGETPPGCDTAYTYQKNDFLISIGFLDDKAVLVSYRKPMKDQRGNKKLSEDVIKYLLKANSGESEWVPRNSIDGDSVWGLDDDYVAIYRQNENALIFMGRDFMTHVPPNSEDLVEEPLEGF